MESYPEDKTYTFNLISYFQGTSFEKVDHQPTPGVIGTELYQLKLASDITFIPYKAEGVQGSVKVEHQYGGNPARYQPLLLGVPQTYANLKLNKQTDLYDFQPFGGKQDQTYLQIDVNKMFAEGFETNAEEHHSSLGVALTLHPTDKSLVWSEPTPVVPQ